MADLSGFDFDEILQHCDEVLRSTELLPAGEYLAEIVESDYKQTRSGNGAYLELVFEIVDGEYKGRQLVERLNLENPNETTVRIAKGTLARILLALDLFAVADSEELHHKPMKIKVEVKADKSGSMQNRISKYATYHPPAAQQQPAPQQQAQQPAQQPTNSPAQQPAAKQPPWKKK